MRNRLFLLFGAVGALFSQSSCRSQQEAAPTAVSPASDIERADPNQAVFHEVQPPKERPMRPAQALPHIIVYRTRGDYRNLVPITLNAEGTAVVSYPAPSDIHPSAKPEDLGNGWLLDHRGVGRNTAFTDYTYEAYAALPAAPSAAELLQHVIDKHPFVEIRDCGTKQLSLDELRALLQAENLTFSD